MRSSVRSRRAPPRGSATTISRWRPWTASVVEYPMSEGPLTAERILEVSEDVLRRYGPAKATVVDVARELGVSHGSVYRHFPSKAALRDAVAERWLSEISAPLAAAAAAEGSAPERLRRWLDLLVESKQSRAREDP